MYKRQILAPLVPTYPIFGGLTLAFLLLLLPVTQGAVDLVNNTVTAVFKAYALPKLDFSKGVPQPFTTLVVVPTLLTKEKQAVSYTHLVCESSMRIVTSPARVNSGRYFETGSSRVSLWSCASRRTAAAVNCLLIDPMEYLSLIHI